MYNLSPIDRKILTFVLIHGINASEREIARKLRLSQATVNYSLKKMQEKKVIKNFVYRINFEAIGLGCLGWVFFVVKRNNFDPDDIPKVLSGFPEVPLIIALNGEYDFCIKIVGIGMKEVSDSLMRIEKALSHMIEISAMVFATKTHKLHQVILPDAEEHEVFDDLSKKILSFKISNPRAGINDICSALKIHRNTASKKWNALYENGTILKKGFILDPDILSQLGFGLKSMVFFNIAPGKKEDFAEEFVKLPEVHELFRVSGHHDFLAIVRTKDPEALFEFHKKLFRDKKLGPMIQRTISRVMLKTKMLNFNPIKLLG
jgi:DNA-binding Lrp family transcriptional regulator